MKKKKVQQIMQVIKTFDQRKANPDINQIEPRIERQVGAKKPINLICFTCSTINDKFMLNKESPWKYISFDVSGNNLQEDVEKLVEIQNKLSKIYPTKVTILIGNTDPYYIYTQGFSIFKKFEKNYLWKKYAQRWRIYQNKFSLWLKKCGLKNFEVISWYEFEQGLAEKMGVSFEKMFYLFLPKIESYFKKGDFESEINKIFTAFGPGKYFPSLKKPNTKTLKIWMFRKFTEYMLQGLFIYLFFPNAILLQNEKPSNLRQKMYQPLIKNNFSDILPNIFPFGVDNIGYQ